jgi:hypothetical protein
MNTLIEPSHPVRSVLRSTGVLGLSLAMTIAVVAMLASFVDSWA